MKYGTYTSFDKMKEDRADRPDTDHLPDKCCANCAEWCSFSDRGGAGTCLEHSRCNSDGSSAFTWADDQCKLFNDGCAQRSAFGKTTLIWRPFTQNTLLVNGRYYLLSDGYSIVAAEFSVEYGKGLFCYNGRYELADDCKYEFIANIHLPEVE